MALRSISKTQEKSRPGVRKLGKLEFVVLQAIWTHEERGEERITVLEILPGVWRAWGLSYHSTIGLVCRALADKGLIAPEQPRNGGDCMPTYRSIVPRDEVGVTVIVQDNEVLFVDDWAAK